jgi:hypothetical protein
MSRLDDHQRRSRAEIIDQRMSDRMGQVFLKDQPMAEHIAKLGDPSEARRRPIGDERDVSLALCGQKMMRTYEHQRDARSDDRDIKLDRKTRTKCLFRRRPISVEQLIGERARRGRRRICERGIVDIEAERAHEIAQCRFRSGKVDLSLCHAKSLTCCGTVS